MAVGEQPDQQAFDEMLLPDDNVGDFLLQRFDPIRAFLHRVMDCLDVGVRTRTRYLGSGTGIPTAPG